MREVCGAYKAGSKFKKLILKFDFQKLIKILISQIPFFDCIIIVRSTKMLAQIAYLRLCAVAYAGFLKEEGGPRKFKKFENNEDENKKVPVQNQIRFPA